MDSTTLAELLLVSLYDLTEEQPHGFFFFPLDEIGARLGATDMGQMMKAAQILESRGFATLSVGPWSALAAMISSDGIIFVEKGGETGIVKAYRNNPQEIMAMVTEEVKASAAPGPDLSPEAVVAQSPSQPSDEMIGNALSRVGLALAEDSTITAPAREDAMKDLETLKIQLSRNSRNWRLIEMLLDSLADVPSLLPSLKDLALILKHLE